jgi:hypothetical protein
VSGKLPLTPISLSMALTLAMVLTLMLPALLAGKP